MEIATMGGSVTQILGVWRAPSGFDSRVAAWVFENQWPWWIGLVALGLVVAAAARSRGDMRVAKIGVGLAGVAIAWMAMAFLMETPAERLRGAHESLAEAAAKQDVEGMVKWFADDFRAPAIGVTAKSVPAEEIRQRLQTYGIKENRITSFRSELGENDSLGKTWIVVLTTSNFGPVKTTWELEWSDVAGGDWRIAYAKLLAVGDQQVRESETIR